MISGDVKRFLKYQIYRHLHASSSFREGDGAFCPAKVILFAVKAIQIAYYEASTRPATPFF